MKRFIIVAAFFWYFIAVVPNGQGGWSAVQYNNFFNSTDCETVATQLRTVNPEIGTTQCWENVSPGGVK